MSHQVVAGPAAAAAHPHEEHGGPVEIAALAPHFEEVRFPTKAVVGYAVSVALTLLALLAVTKHLLPPAGLLATVLALAAVQALLQLGSFMHLREAGGETWQLPVIILAFGIAVGIVIFSVWIMSFKWGVS